MLNIKKFIKGLRILNSNDQTKSLEINVIDASTTSTKTTLNIQQTANRTLSTPLDSTSGEFVISNSPQVITGKTIVVANNTITTAAAGNLAATELNAALNELQLDVDTRATTVALNNHVNNTTDAHDASAISVIPTGNLVSVNVQAALVELQAELDTVGTFANQSLSNLTTTAINQDLSPSVNFTRDLGSSGFWWANVRASGGAFNQIVFPNTAILDITAPRPAPSGIGSSDFTIYAPNLAKNIGIYGGDPTSSNGGSIFIETAERVGVRNAGALSLYTGSVVNGAGANISLRTGASTGSGIRGNITLDAPEVNRLALGVEVINEAIGKNISLASNVTNSTIAQFTTPLANYKSMQIQYSATISGEKRTGTLFISATVSNVAIADTFVETLLTSLSFSAIISGSDIIVRQSNTDVGAVTMSYKLTKFRE